MNEAETRCVESLYQRKLAALKKSLLHQAFRVKGDAHIFYSFCSTFFGRPRRYTSNTAATAARSRSLSHCTERTRGRVLKYKF